MVLNATMAVAASLDNYDAVLAGRDKAAGSVARAQLTASQLWRANYYRASNHVNV